MHTVGEVINKTINNKTSHTPRWKYQDLINSFVENKTTSKSGLFLMVLWVINNRNQIGKQRAVDRGGA